MFRKQRFFAGIVIAVLAIMTFVVPLASNAESAAAVGGNGHWKTVSMPTVVRDEFSRNSRTWPRLLAICNKV